jgi:hypothetical protein
MTASGISPSTPSPSLGLAKPSRPAAPRPTPLPPNSHSRACARLATYCQPSPHSALPCVLLHHASHLATALWATTCAAPSASPGPCKKTGDGRYRYPLTVADGYSRFLLACQALHSTAVHEAKPIFTRVFQECGLPSRIRTDNGVPCATNTLARLSQLSA